MYHYVYRIDHIETNEFYIGVRSSNKSPIEDKYMGSPGIWKPDKSKLVKTILNDKFKTREDANNFEVLEITKVINNELNRNYHIPNKGFCTHGFVTVKDNNGKCFNVKSDDPRFLSHELVGACKNMQLNKINVSDENGNVKKVDKTDPMYLSGELKPFSYFSKQFWLNKGLSENDAINKIVEIQKNNRKKSNQIGEKNPQFGTCWIYNKVLKQNKKIKKCDIVPIGWELGKIQKHWP